MPTTLKEMLAAANAAVPRVPPAEAKALIERGDTENPYHNAAFAKDKTVLVYCASGGRSALSGKTLKDLGYAAVFNIGGFKELADAGLETEPG